MKNLIIIASCLFLVSCGKNFLKLEPQSDANTEIFYKTQEDFNTALNGIYSSLRTYPNMYLEMSSYRSDELVLAAPTAGTQDRYDLDKFQDNPSNGLLLSTWSNLYNGIALCNELLYKLKTVSFDENLMKQYEAEARFVRAYHYYNLVNFWGRIPLSLNPITPAEALKLGQSEKQSIFEAIENDLNFAFTDSSLPDVFTGSNIGRTNAIAAKVLLAKVYMLQNKYQQAKELLEPYISSGGQYDLLESVSNVFSVSNKMNKEIIFAIRYNKDFIGQGHGLWFSTTSASVTQVPKTLNNSYETTDQRKSLLEMVRSGTTGNNYVPRKFLDTYSTTITSQVGNDYPLIRYPEILLLFAEASNEISFDPSGAAIRALNRVRSRSAASSYNATTLSSKETFRNAVLKERYLEFPYEGQRWFDLVRTGAAINTMRFSEGSTVQNFRLIYPIPYNEIEKINDSNLLKQNEGY